MKALVKARAEPGLWLADVPRPGIGAGEVLIRVLRTGICGTDLHIHGWDGWAQRNIAVPLVVGHEFVGQIVEIGADVEDLAPGDLVSARGTWSAVPAATAAPAAGTCAPAPTALA